MKEQRLTRLDCMPTHPTFDVHRDDEDSVDYKRSSVCISVHCTQLPRGGR